MLLRCQSKSSSKPSMKQDQDRLGYPTHWVRIGCLTSSQPAIGLLSVTGRVCVHVWLILVFSVSSSVEPQTQFSVCWHSTHTHTAVCIILYKVMTPCFHSPLIQMFLVIQQLLRHMFKNEITRLQSGTENVTDSGCVDAKGHAAIVNILMLPDPWCTGEPQ